MMKIKPLDFNKSDWRLLITEPASGAWNMAVDEALLGLMDQPDQKPILRLYSWSPPCLSLGYAQPVTDVNREVLEKRGWDLVRRATGGRAILHTDELTYSVITPINEPRMAGGVLDSYKRISLALFSALKHLNLNIEITEKKVSPRKETDPVCFDIPSIYEITLDGKKIIGSAQARKASGILQHGAFPLSGDISRIADGLMYESEAERDKAKGIILEKATTAETKYGIISWQEAADAFIQEFSKVLNISFKSSKLLLSELEKIKLIELEKLRIL